jgi:cob(I)alamin adenosyltransferase
MTSEIQPLKRFVLPGGAEPAAWLHFARSVCRRAEREAMAMREHAHVPDGVIVYLNRLSDFLFTAARWVNHRLKTRETQWLGLKR